jgi:hypothetical protein
MFSFLNEQMGFIEALREIHASNMFKKHASRIEAEIQGVREDLQYHVGSVSSHASPNFCNHVFHGGFCFYSADDLSFVSIFSLTSARIRFQTM